MSSKQYLSLSHKPTVVAKHRSTLITKDSFESSNDRASSNQVIMRTVSMQT